MTEAIARDQLRSIIGRIERLTEEAKALSDDKAEVYAEAKANGFNTRVIKMIVKRRARDTAELDEEDALFDLYMAALAGAPARETDANRPTAADVRGILRS